jgi:hypothetical protein
MADPASEMIMRPTRTVSMPFGFLQTVAILIGCYAAYKFKIKSAVLVGLTLVTAAPMLGSRPIASQR